MKTALLVVDLQYDFMPGGALAVKGGDEVVPLINALMGNFDYTIASQDWHPERHVSFATTHGKIAGESIEIDGVKQELWPIHCVQNTHGASLVEELKKDPIDHYFRKGIDRETDSYSAFFDNGKKRETGLDAFLKEHEVTKLYIAGLTTDFCVKYSALDALELGYEVIVIADACRAVFDKKDALKEMQQAGAEIVTVNSLDLGLPHLLT
ncbi:MAG: bifunctional nicotinamidase/pyrazinamidase [Chlamydiia bacterium]|nr:bifunctional nicotinamidase/pyrazinamidase [Chlamydiia bacterium]